MDSGFSIFDLILGHGVEKTSINYYIISKRGEILLGLKQGYTQSHGAHISNKVKFALICYPDRVDLWPSIIWEEDKHKMLLLGSSEKAA